MNPQIGQQLRDRRLELGLSLRVLQERCGVDNSMIYKIETGRVRDTSIEKLSAIAAALDTSLAIILMQAQAIDTPTYRQYLGQLLPELPEETVNRLESHLKRTAHKEGITI